MNPFFILDYDALVHTLLPVRLRQPLMTAWLRCLIHPVKWLYDRFMQQRMANLYTLSRNSQVVYLQAALNDTFDAALRRIYITDGVVADPLWVYLYPENLPLPLALASELGTPAYPSPQWLYTPTEVASSSYSFIVWLPAGLVYDPVRLRALIDRYRLPSRSNYLIS